MNPRLSVIPAAAVTDARIEARDLQVLCLLGRHIDDNGWCRRSQVKMAREIRCARSTLQASLARLVDADYVAQRIETRPSGGDAAHSYRVILDPQWADSSAPPKASDCEASTEQGADQSAGVKNDADADLSAGVGQGVPIHASAPMLTTPLNKPEREARACDGEEGNPTSVEALLALRKDWPDFALESQERSLLALSRLSPAERQTAVERVPDFLVFHREKRGKARLPYLHNYLAEKRWEGVPQQVKAVPKAEDGAVVKAFSRAWWWCFVRYVEAHGDALRDTTSGRAGWLRVQVSKSLRFAGTWPIDPAKHAEIEEQAANRLTKHPKDGEHARRWKAHYQFEFNVAMPLPDQAEWVWLPPQLPSTGPPAATAVETVERDMATEGV